VRLCPDLQCKNLYFGDGWGRDVIGSNNGTVLPPQLKQTASIPLSKKHYKKLGVAKFLVDYFL
jgi:hypothetical protein